MQRNVYYLYGDTGLLCGLRCTLLVAVWFMIMLWAFPLSSFVYSILFFLMLSEFLGGIINASMFLVFFFVLETSLTFLGLVW